MKNTTKTTLKTTITSEVGLPKHYAVQHYTLCDGWENTWRILDETGEVPWVFSSKAAAQAELDAFFQEIEQEVKNGDREAENSYEREEFCIVSILPTAEK